MSEEHEEMVNVDVKIPQDILDKYNKLTKKELLNHLWVAILKIRVQEESIERQDFDMETMTIRLKHERTDSRHTQNNLDQAKAMLELIMEDW